MKVAIFVMQKDESDLLEPWIRYHESLFDADSLFIFDNGSSRQNVFDVLESAESRGAHIYREFNRPVDFENKNQYFGRIVAENAGRFDFFMPLDADEFLAFMPSPDELSTDRTTIDGELSRFLQTASPINIKGAYFNAGSAPDRFYFFPDHRKSFFRDGTFHSIDHGFHNGRSLNGEIATISNLVHIHMHYKPFEILVEHARNKLAPYVQDFSIETLRAYKGGGNHLVDYLLWTKEEYLGKFSPEMCVKLAPFREKILALGLRYPLFGAEES